MTFGVVAPAALGLAALLALPVVAHLTRRTPTDRVAFGAMMLIERLVKRLRRRRTIKDRRLLALRALALLAAVSAMAGPYVAWPDLTPEYTGSGRVVIVLDRSMSMSLHEGGGSLLARAKGEAAARISALPQGTQVGFVTYAAAAEPRTDALTDDRERVLALLDAIEPSDEPGDLRGALLEARRQLAGEPGEVLVLSDEAGPVMIPGAAEEVERLVSGGSAVLPVPAHAEPPRNVAVLGVSYGDGVEGGQVVVRAANYGPEPVEVPCEVQLPDGAQIPVFVTLPAEGEAEARVTVPRRAEGGVGVAHCEDAALASDDRRFFHMPSVGASRVLVVDGDPGDTPVRSEVYFLERALAPWGGEHAGVLPDVVAPSGLGDVDPSTHRLVFLANVSDPRPYGPRLRDFVRRGGTLVIGGGENVTAERYNEALGPILPSPIRLPRSLADLGEEPAHLVAPDPSIPLFEPFARAGRAGFTRVGAWRVLTLEPFAETDEVKTLLRYEGGVPALVARSVGAGHVLVWTSTFDLGWANLPLQAVFMPLVQRIASVYGGDSGSRAERLDAVLGDRVTFPLPDGARAEVVGPDGAVAPSQIEGAQLVFTPAHPGGYGVRLEDGPVLAWVAVNTDPMESDVRRTHTLASVEARWKPELFERRVELAPGLLGAALALVLAAAWIGSRGTA
ncbi:MAG TPA: VWA domain-containing protein [Myxococcota bacterium]|nr:VWA domain-containing protein [Myxococcota bacterium]